MDKRKLIEVNRTPRLSTHLIKLGGEENSTSPWKGHGEIEEHGVNFNDREKRIMDTAGSSGLF
jgi:hypothetical protein